MGHLSNLDVILFICSNCGWVPRHQGVSPRILVYQFLLHPALFMELQRVHDQSQLVCMGHYLSPFGYHQGGVQLGGVLVGLIQAGAGELVAHNLIPSVTRYRG
jgi:hypothetical protein